MNDFWKGRRVLVTGHTGFKGGWLALWLHRLRAQVHGYALDPVGSPNLFEALRLGDLLASDTRSDICDAATLKAAVTRAQPEIVFHLAAQPLVRQSYKEPIATFQTNILGTAHLLEAVREVESVRAVVVVTTDKVYQNHEWLYPYREMDGLGGHDPYSASKAAAEIVAASYRDSFLGARQVSLATARAGNVIGGGDWAVDRLVPDCLQSFQQGLPVVLRYPDAVRPWQHVLEPLSGYLLLAQRLSGSDGLDFASAWNFGPSLDQTITVREAAEMLAQLWGDGACIHVSSLEGKHPHEAGLLKLDISKTQGRLGWRPRWCLRNSLQAVVDWQQAFLRGDDMQASSYSQIEEYEKA